MSATKPLPPEGFADPSEQRPFSSDSTSGRGEAVPLSSSSSSRSSIIDEGEVLERLEGDRSLLAEISALFLSEYPALLTALRAGIASNNAQAVYQAAHALKGAVGNFSATAAFEAAQRLEDMGRRDDLSAAVAAIMVLEQELVRLRPILVAFAAETSPS